MEDEDMTLQLSIERRYFPSAELATAFRELVYWIGCRVFRDEDGAWLALGPVLVRLAIE
jgi:hypothetical protein